MFLALKRAVWFAEQKLAKQVAVQNVRLQLLCITVTFDETNVLPYWSKLEAARSKCSVALPSIDRYLSALDSSYCISSSFLPKHDNRVGSNRVSSEATHPYLWNQDSSFAGNPESVLQCVLAPHPAEIWTHCQLDGAVISAAARSWRKSKQSETGISKRDLDNY